MSRQKCLDITGLVTVEVNMDRLWKKVCVLHMHIHSEACMCEFEEFPNSLSKTHSWHYLITSF